MTERLVVIPHGGTLNMYAVNGEGPHLVGTLVVGTLDDYTTAMVGAAFADLRAVATTGHAAGERPAPEVVPPGMRDALATWPEPEHERPALKSARRPHTSKGTLAAKSLNGRIRAYLAEHGPSTSGAIFTDVQPEATRTKTSRQRLSTSLASLQHSGHAQREGKGQGAVWSLTAAGIATPTRAAPSAPATDATPPTTPELVSRAVPVVRSATGPGATWRRVTGEA